MEYDMTQDEFRIKHSMLIENYQHIEKHLEAILSCLKKPTIYEGLKEVEKTNLHRLLILVEKAEKQSGKEVLSERESERLRELFERRNFWTHDCYTTLCFDAKTGGLRFKKDIDALNHDLYESEDVRRGLQEKKIVLLQKRGSGFFDLNFDQYGPSSD